MNIADAASFVLGALLPPVAAVLGLCACEGSAPGRFVASAIAEVEPSWWLVRGLLGASEIAGVGAPLVVAAGVAMALAVRIRR